MPQNRTTPHRPRPRRRTTLTLAQVRKLPAACRVEDAAAVLGIGRATAYDLITAGKFPVRVIPVGRQMKVVTSALIALLEAGDPAGGKAGAA